MLHILGWLIMAWIGGTAFILGSLMLIAVGLLGFLPGRSPHPSTRRTSALTPLQGNDTDLGRPRWLMGLSLMGVVLLLTVSGAGLVLWVPFPGS